MKKIVLISLLLVICCDKPESERNNFFKGNHRLLSLNTFIKIKNETSSFGFFFVFVGEYSSSDKNEKEPTVRFCWENNNKEYVISELPLKQVRFQIDSTINEPYCKFRWYSGPYLNEEYWYSNVIYVLFVLQEKHILKSNVNLDLNP